MKTNKLFIPTIFILFLLSALVLRLQFILSDRLWPDEALYASHASAIGAHFNFIFTKEANEFHFPLFSFLLSFGRGLFFSPVEGYRFLSILFNWFGLFVTFVLAKEMLGVKTALLSLAFLVLNIAYFNNAGFILVDGILTTAQTVFILSLYRLHRFSRSNVAFFLLSGLLMIYLKWYSILFVLPISAGYFVFSSLKLDIKKLFLLLFTLCLFSLPIFLKIFSIFKAGGPASFHYSPWWYYFSINPILLGGILPTIFFVYGVCVLKVRKPPVFALLILWIFVYFSVLSCVTEKDVRYVLPIIPCLSILSGYGLYSAILVFFNSAPVRGIAFKVILALLLVFSFSTTLTADSSYLHGYTGFFEAGEWVKQHSLVDTPIFAGSTRAINFTAGIPLKRFGGLLEPLPPTLGAFKTLLAQQTKSSILEIDLWEYTQPGWAYPLTAEKARELEKVTTMHLSNVVYRNYAGRVQPVLWLFKN